MKSKAINNTWIVVFVAVLGLYVASTLISNIASLRILTLGGFSVDAGTLIYPLVFTLRDLVHKVAGTAAARAVILISAIANIVMAGLFALIAKLPADMMVGPQQEWVQVLSPSYRIVAASLVAMTIATLIDTEAYRLWVRRFGEKYQFGRVLSSNAVSVPIDSAIFCLIAFGGVLPGAVILSIFWANVLIKGATSLITFPLIYTIRPKEEWTLEGQIK